MRLQELLEGVHDPHTFKAVFVLGGPGSGKTYVSRKITGGSGLRPINVDDIYEFLSSKIGGGYKQELYKQSGALMQRKLDTYIDGRLGLLIDGTGRNKRLPELKARLDSLGYDSLAIFVNTDVETALARNDARARKVDTDILKHKHAELKQTVGDLQRMFQGKFVVVDNTDPEKVDLPYYSKIVSQFLDTPPTKPAARQWLSGKK